MLRRAVRVLPMVTLPRGGWLGVLPMVSALGACSPAGGFSTDGRWAVVARAVAGSLNRMLNVPQAIWRFGGLAQTAELYSVGCWQSQLQWCMWYRQIIHVRRGWWAALDTPQLAIRARQAGGRLACVSALQLYGEGEPDGLLHVAYERSGKRSRDPLVVAHWSRRTLPGTRLAVSLEVAREQAARCAYNQSRFLNER